MRRRVLWAPVMVLALVLPACGSDDNRASLPSLTLPSRPTEPTATEPPATEPPVTEPPVTEPPATEPPVTEPPVTEPPVTEPPATGDEAAGEPADDGGPVWWAWLAALAVAVGLGAVLVVGRRRKTPPSWEDRAAGLIARLDQVTTRLSVTTAEALPATAPGEGRLLAELGVALQHLVPDVPESPDPSLRLAMDHLRMPLVALQAAVDRVALTPGPPTEEALAEVRELAARLYTASSTVRAHLAARRPD